MPPPTPPAPTRPAPGAADALLGVFSAHPSVGALERALAEGRHVIAQGAAGSSSAFLAAALARAQIAPTLLLIAAHPDEADELSAEINGLLASDPALNGAPDAAIVFPALEVAPGESHPSVEQFAERIAVVRALASGIPPRVVVAPMSALMQRVPEPARLDTLSRVLEPGGRADPQDLARWLDDAGYRRAEAADAPGEYALRGGILDVFPPPLGDLAAPVRIDCFGDEIDKLAEIDPDTMGSDRKLARVELTAVRPELILPTDDAPLLPALLPAGACAIIQETAEVVEQGRGYYERVSDSMGVAGPPAVLKATRDACRGLAEINQFSKGSSEADARIDLPLEPLPPFEREARLAIAELAVLAQSAHIVVCAQNAGEAQRAGELSAEHAAALDRPLKPDVDVRYVHRGFVWGDGTAEAGTRTAVVPYHELIHRYDTRRSAKRIRAGRAMDTFLDLTPGDYVVHADHGIARFAGLALLSADGKDAGRTKPGKRAKADPADAEEYLTLEFSGRSRLQVPCSSIDLVQKYVGGFQGKPPLSTLGGIKWKNQKSKVADSVRDLAAEMLRVRAAREAIPGTAYPADTAWQTEFEAEFPYDETEDQLAALAEIKKDMHHTRPMDRLLCGDVGFGKTEVAVRGAFKACEFGKQVAVLVPTTVLAEQHERTFRSRFAGYPFRVESISRFKTTKQVSAVLRDLRKGQVDVIIGTHRLLSKDVKFADLGLVVVDEEQRFGVEHKERLLQLRATVDVLTLSATPIPRTLHMSMLGLRDISSLTTPPADRRAIVTEVLPYNEQRLARALQRELAREGQAYVVHNRVNDIHTVAADIQSLAPGARVVVGHGQMEPKDLEQVMLTFMRREADILVSTTIIESGIDIPTANTMIVLDADRFGLADLHQLRGRVGRYKHRAYCYLMLPKDRPVKEVAQKRLKAIEQFSMLGAGFKIAMRDLEIRGAGNLLGAEQSGHIAAVGYDMFCRLLEGAVRELANAGEPEPVEHVALDLAFGGRLPKAYIPSDVRRLEAYRRLASATGPEELAKAETDIADAYGALPQPARRLLDVQGLRMACRLVHVRALVRRGEDLVFLTAEPERVVERLGDLAGQLRSISADLAQTNARTPTGRPLAEVYWRPPEAYREPESLLRVLTRRLAGV